MRELLKETLGNLIIKSKFAEKTRNKILASENDPTKAQALLNEITREANLNNCTRCDSRHFCALFLACINYELGDISEMQRLIQRAIRDFYLVGSKWNESFAHWINGRLYLTLGHTMPAIKELENAIEMFEQLARKFRAEDDYEKRDECLKYIEEIRATVNLLNNTSPTENKFAPNPANVKPNNSAATDAYLVFPWLQIYEDVQAGRNGYFWTSNDETCFAEISTVSLGGHAHTVHSTKPGDKRIRLRRTEDYGWAQVRGQSMNNTEPTAIHEGNYVLFAKTPVRNEHDIVVVAFLEQGDASRPKYMVKRYKDNMLYSETTLNGDEFNPLEANKCEIIGIVIAVAKPINKEL